MAGGYFNDDQNDQMKAVLYPYLMDKAKRRAMQTSGDAYAARESGYRQDENNADARGLVSVFGDSASMAGTLQGKRSDVGQLPKYMNELTANDQERNGNLFKERAAEEQALGTDLSIARFVGDQDNKDKDLKARTADRDEERKARLQQYLTEVQRKRDADAQHDKEFGMTYSQRERQNKEGNRLREKAIDKPAVSRDPALQGPGGIIPGYVDADGNPMTYNPKTGAQGSLKLPPGAKPTKTPEAQKLTEDEAKRGLSARIAMNELTTLEGMEKTYRPGARSVAAGIAGKILGDNVENVAKSEDDQRYDAANARIVDPLLRATTGAGYTHEEILNKLRGYTVRPGDTEKTIQEKHVARRQFVQGILESARRGGAGMSMPSEPAGGGAPPISDAAPAPPKKLGPPVGTKKFYKGQLHEFNGGDPNDPASWPVAQGGQ